MFSLITLAGTPATIQFSGTSFITTAFAATKEFLPTTTGPITFAPVEIIEFS